VKNAALLAISVLLATYAQLVWKARSLVHAVLPIDRQYEYIWGMLWDPWIWSGLLGTVLGMLSWMLVLRDLELSVAYPTMAAVFVLVVLGAHFLLGESLTAGRLIGLGLIVSGITVVAMTA
jgi:drug/metabolite transporter (DMT)-like permease